MIRDDPKKYPAKEDLGFFAGATGGWAGGEAGLWKLREEVIAGKAGKPKAAAKPAAAAAAKPAAGAVYVGKGRFIEDSPEKYPGKEDLGFFAGATGGFAAGEKGLKQYVRDGELRLRRDGQPGGQQGSPVSIAFLTVAGGLGGGLGLNALADAATAAAKAELAASGLDQGAQTAALAGAAVAGAALLVAAGYAAAGALRERMSDGDKADRVVLLGAASLGLFLASRVILEL